MREILFGTDIAIYKYFYDICKTIGSCFYIGVEGGAFILFGGMGAVILQYWNRKDKK